MSPRKPKLKKAPVKKLPKKEKELPKPAEVMVAEKPKRAFNLLRGMHDILPKDEKYWKTIYHTAENLADYFQFGRVETPVLEEANLYVRSVGRGTDIVDKEMYVFEDKDGTKVALRPEGTASTARAYISNGLWNLAQPVKVWYFEPMFRHDRPQGGRYRQHYQVGFETFGAKESAIDSELVLVGYNFFKDLGIPVEVHINSIGLPEERERYVNELANFYRTKRSYLCEDCRARLTRNPFRLLDCKEVQCQPIKEQAPQIIDWLGEESKDYFMKVLEFLDELGVPYLLMPTLVRGLDYYTHTIFEFFTAAGGEAGANQVALGGGGRYDLLVEELGGKPTPAAGMGLGVERTVYALREFGDKAKAAAAIPTPEIFFAQLGEDGKRRMLKIIDELRASGIRIAYNLSKGSLKNQLEIANGMGVAHVLILGQKEVQDKTVIVRDMESGVQEIVDQKKIEIIVKKKLGKV